MSITKEIKFDQITITDNGVILARQATSIVEDGVELSKAYHRYSLPPGADVSNMPQNVQDICATVWTPEVIADYAAKKNTPLTELSA